MNCKVSHTDDKVYFLFTKKEDGTKTQVIFNKRNKQFSVDNTEDYYGDGYTLTVKEFNYCVKYLEKGCLL